MSAEKIVYILWAPPEWDREKIRGSPDPAMCETW